MMKITENTKISSIMRKYPQLAEILMFKHGLHCVGCMGASFETLGEGAKVHGMSKKEIEKMVEALNKLI